MGRTLKDKKDTFRREPESILTAHPDGGMKRRYLNFKKSGPPVDGETCPECGGLTDFRSGFLTCCECGWTEDVVEMFEMERFSA